MFDNAQTWRASMQDVEADIDDEFGEPLRITPVVPVNRGQPVPLPAQAKEVRGRFSDPSTLALKPSKGPARADVGTSVRTSEPRASLSLATLNGLGFPVVVGTWIERVEERKIYTVTDRAPDGVSRVVYGLTMLGRSSALAGLATARADVPVVEGPSAAPPAALPSRPRPMGT